MHKKEWFSHISTAIGGLSGLLGVVTLGGFWWHQVLFYRAALGLLIFIVLLLELRAYLGGRNSRGVLLFVYLAYAFLFAGTLYTLSFVEMAPWRGFVALVLYFGVVGTVGWMMKRE